MVEREPGGVFGAGSAVTVPADRGPRNVAVGIEGLGVVRFFIPLSPGIEDDLLFSVIDHGRA